MYRLVGLVVKASASGAEDPRFESRLRRDFSGLPCQAPGVTGSEPVLSARCQFTVTG